MWFSTSGFFQLNKTTTNIVSVLLFFELQALGGYHVTWLSGFLCLWSDYLEKKTLSDHFSYLFLCYSDNLTPYNLYDFRLSGKKVSFGLLVISFSDSLLLWLSRWFFGSLVPWKLLIFRYFVFWYCIILMISYPAVIFLHLLITFVSGSPWTCSSG
jgi:hypothetical protein